ncbi:MAG: YMGG-like glycine zipper-containing protein [Akkermansiaceae bacterium]
MKNTIIAISAAASILTLSNCAPPGTAAHQDAIGGAAIGAIGGAIIGNQSGHALEGAALGAAAGGAAGHHIGQSKDRARQQYHQPPRRQTYPY